SDVAWVSSPRSGRRGAGGVSQAGDLPAEGDGVSAVVGLTEFFRVAAALPDRRGDRARGETVADGLDRLEACVGPAVAVREQLAVDGILWQAGGDEHGGA